MRDSIKAALCGIISSLAVVIMLSTYLSPFLVYTAPVFSGLLLIVILNEIDYKWSIGTYVTVSLISAFIVADKEASVFYTMFFGYYPIHGFYINKKIKSRILNIIAKLFAFNISCVISFLLCSYVIAVDMSDFTEGGIAFTVIFWLMMNILFFVYEILLSRLQILYLIRFQKKIRKLFNIR